MNTAFLLLNSSKSLKYNLNQALELYDITAQQWAVLQQIERTTNGQVITASQLSTFLEIDKQTLSGIIKRLEGKKLITKEKSSKDRRAFALKLALTERDKLNKYKEISELVLEQFLLPLSLEERVQLNQLLQKLQQGEK